MNHDFKGKLNGSCHFACNVFNYPAHYYFDKRIIYSMHNYLCVSASVCTNMLLIMQSVDSVFLLLASAFIKYLLFGSIPVFSTRNSKLKINQIHMLSHLAVVRLFWNKHTPHY